MPEEFDQQKLDQLAEMMKERVHELIYSYLESSEKYIRAIANAMEEGNDQDVEHAAHPLKSSSAVLGLTGMQVIASEIERLASLKKRQDADQVKLLQLVNAVCPSFDRAKNYLQTFLSKPIECEDVESASELSVVNVLHVDDEAIIRKVTARILTGNGFHVQSYESVADALKNLGDYKPDVILVDFIMPDTEGITSLLSFKSDHRLSEIPVLFVTGVSEEKVMESLEGKIEGYVPKPYKPEELVERIKGLI